MEVSTYSRDNFPPNPGLGLQPENLHLGSGRSEATIAFVCSFLCHLFILSWFIRQGGFLSQGFPLEIDLVGVVDEAVEDGIGQGGVSDHLE